MNRFHSKPKPPRRGGVQEEKSVFLTSEAFPEVILKAAFGSLERKAINVWWKEMLTEGIQRVTKKEC